MLFAGCLFALMVFDFVVFVFVCCLRFVGLFASPAVLLVVDSVVGLLVPVVWV